MSVPQSLDPSATSCEHRRRPLRSSASRVDFQDRAFTLVEMLTLISILVLLSALLLPVFRSAKRSTLRTSCASNLHQVGIAFELYASGDDDRYPAAADQEWIDHPEDWVRPEGVALGSIPSLIEALEPYAGNLECFRCPSDTLPYGRSIGEHGVSVHPSRFAYDRASYRFEVPYFFAQPRSHYGPSLPLSWDDNPLWHSDYSEPNLFTPTENVLYADAHVRFSSGWQEVHDLGEASEGR